MDRMLDKTYRRVGRDQAGVKVATNSMDVVLLWFSYLVSVRQGKVY